MPLILSLEQVLNNEGCHFHGRILLHGHKKTTGAAYKLGTLHNSNTSQGLSVHSMGKNLIFIVDLVSMFHTLEQHQKMPTLERGQRALSILAIYTMVGTDYLTTSGIDYKQGCIRRPLFQTVRAVRYEQ